MKKFLPVIKSAVKSFFQKLFITFQLYKENGLANHAAAGAYGFLLSMAPMLLLLAFLFFYILGSSPGTITALIGTIPFLGNMFDEKWLSSDFFILANPGIPGIISAITIIWSGRILALSIQRGLRIVFPARRKRSTVKYTLVTLAIEAAVIILVLIAIISSRTAMRFYKLLDFLPEISFIRFITSQFGIHISSITLLGIASYCVYLFVPVKPPNKLSAFHGAVICSIIYFATVLVLGIFINKVRINFLYGTFGNLIIILINVFFFFMFFFFGAQYAFVNDHYEELMFSRLRILKRSLIKSKSSRFLDKFRFSSLIYELFHPSGNILKKYLKIFKEGEIIFSQNDGSIISNDVFYILDGEVEIKISSVNGEDEFSDLLKPDSFFGRMGYIISEHETAVAKSICETSIIVIPPVFFKAITKYDNFLDRTLIKAITRRFK